MGFLPLLPSFGKSGKMMNYGRSKELLRVREALREGTR